MSRPNKSFTQALCGLVAISLVVSLFSLLAVSTSHAQGDAPGGWVYEWSAIGKYYENLGDELTQRGPRRAALDAYMTASVYYALAWFPYIDSDEQDRAYTAQLRAYQKAWPTSVTGPYAADSAYQTPPQALPVSSWSSRWPSPFWA